MIPADQYVKTFATYKVAKMFNKCYFLPGKMCQEEEEVAFVEKEKKKEVT